MAKVEETGLSCQGLILGLKREELNRAGDGNFRELEAQLVQGNHVIRAPCRAPQANSSTQVGRQERHESPETDLI
jgi:hypothetical protein